MTGREQQRVVNLTMVRAALLLVVAAAVPAGALAAPDAPVPSGPAGGETDTVAPPRHMPEALRAEVRNVVVIAGRRPAGQGVSGTYAKDTAGLVGGMADGSRLGRIERQVGPVPVYIPIPVLTIPGAVFGGLSGATRRQIQDFRDALTEELAGAENNAIKDDGLALDVFWGLRKVPGLDSRLFSPTTPVPEGTDAVLYVNFNDVGIDVQGKDAVITTTAEATLRRLSDGRDLYETAVHYRDRDTLRNWTANDNALWRDYANYARHYLGRALAADLFGAIEVQRALQPQTTDSVKPDSKNPGRYISASLSPTLAWELIVSDADPELPWSGSVSDADIFYDLEIYDAHRLVYFEEQIPGAQHTVAVELEPCKTYRWSVRPAYRYGNELRFGRWMRYPPPAEAGDTDTLPAPGKGIIGRAASVAPAYTQDFASLEVACRRR